MNIEEFREHCEKQIERCIKLNNSKHLKEHELALGLLNENERLIQENQEYKETLNKIKNKIEKKIEFCENEAEGTINNEKCHIAILFLKGLLEDLKEVE